MEKHQQKYILKNLAKLIACTKNEPTLVTQLRAEDFISRDTWQIINRENPDTESRLRCLYEECFKTPQYDLLIQCLEDSDNEHAANILKKIDTPGAAQNVSSVPATSTTATKPTSAGSEGTSKTSYTDFVVENNHVKDISKIVNEGMEEKEWQEVKINWLPQKIRNNVGKKDSMKLDIMACLSSWISATSSEQRSFSKILEAFEDYPNVADKLKKSSSSISS